MVRTVALSTLLLTALTAGTSPNDALAADPPALQLTGRGVQIYTCKAEGPTFAWTLAGPEADLTDESGRSLGRHFAGPTWKASDGSAVVGQALSSSPSPEADSVPWLVLKAKSHGGVGLFSDVAYITRTATKGGTPPAGGCDAAHLDQQSRAPYSALYTFFPAKAALDH